MSAPPARSHTPPAKAASIPLPAPSPRSSHRAAIQVNAIACGVIDTEMNACFSAEERAQLAEEIPAGRFGAPEEVASLAVQITTGNDYLTGQIITLDGGYL